MKGAGYSKQGAPRLIKTVTVMNAFFGMNRTRMVMDINCLPKNRMAGIIGLLDMQLGCEAVKPRRMQWPGETPDRGRSIP